MNKKHLTLSLASAAVLALLAGATPQANAQTYTVTDLGVLPAKKASSPTAINNQGNIVGSSMSDESDSLAFVYNSDKGQIGALGDVLADSVTRAFGINDAGVAVGDSSFGGAAFGPSPFVHAALFSNGNSADLGSLTPGEYSRANGINLAGTVVGFAGPKKDSSASRAFVWTANSGMIDLGTLGGDYAQAFSINDAGFITGSASTADDKTGQAASTMHAFLYQYSNNGLARPMRDLGTLGGASSYGVFVNANSHVVGYSLTSEGRMHAFLHAGGKMADLGSLGGKNFQSDQSFALGVNAADQVVGYTYLPDDNAGAVYPPPQPVAFIYQNGVMTDLNTLIESAAKTYIIDSAVAINDRGQITAHAMDRSSNSVHAVLLTPRLTYPPQGGVRGSAKR
ncbi:MAG: hypothetical protein ABI992_00885 [Chthoniobacterales bacterium]